MNFHLRPKACSFGIIEFLRLLLKSPRVIQQSPERFLTRQNPNGNPAEDRWSLRPLWTVSKVVTAG